MTHDSTRFELGQQPPDLSNVQHLAEDCSSVNTFEGVCGTLSVQRPAAFLLENVDMEPSKNVSKRQEVNDQPFASIMRSCARIAWQ